MRDVCVGRVIRVVQVKLHIRKKTDSTSCVLPSREGNLAMVKEHFLNNIRIKVHTENSPKKIRALIG